MSMPVQSNIVWTWSEPHRDYYYATYGTNGQLVYTWASQTATITAAPTTANPYHVQTDSQQTTPAAPTTTYQYHVRTDSQQTITPSDTTAGAQSTPAPAVPSNVRQREPNFIAGTPERGWYDSLDPSYRMRTGSEARRFFVLGRVFSMLYTEAAGANSVPEPDDEAFTVVRFDALVHTQIRRFVVVSVRRNFVHACAISTYRNQGTYKRGCDPREHALVYNYGIDPETCYFAGERERGLTKEPIQVEAADPSANLTRESRIRFGKIYSIECNVKVKDIGVVSEAYLDTLLAHHRAEDSRYDT